MICRNMLTKKQSRIKTLMSKKVVKNHKQYYQYYKEVYELYLTEFTLKKNKCIAQYNECKKYINNLSDLTKNFISLSSLELYPENGNFLSNERECNRYIDSIKNITRKVFEEWKFLYGLSEVYYRRRYNLLHTLPRKKLEIFENVFPEIRRFIKKSRSSSFIRTKYTYPDYNKQRKVTFCNT